MTSVPESCRDVEPLMWRRGFRLRVTPGGLAVALAVAVSPAPGGARGP